MNEAENLKLVELVRREVKLYGSLLHCEQGKLDLYLAGRAEDICRANSEGEKLVDEIRSCEREIKAAFPGMSLMERLKQLRHPYRTILEALVQDFKRLTEELNQVNLRNFRFVQNSLCYTRGVLQGAYWAPSNYDRRGAVESGAPAVRNRHYTF
jgi:hypothetical protein